MLATFGLCLFVVFSLHTRNIYANQYKYELLNENDGFSTSIIFSMVQDENGFLWFGTGFSGIMRFDGKSVVVFNNDPQNTNSLPFDNAGNLLLDRNNKLWIGSWGAGVLSFNLNTQAFRQYGHPDDLSTTIASTRVQSVFEDHEGEIWFGTYSGDVNKYNPESDDFTSITMFDASKNDVDNLRVWDIEQTTPEGLWVATDLGLKFLHHASGRYSSFLPQPAILTTGANRIRKIVLGSEGQLFLGTQNGVLAFDTINKTFTPLPVDDFAGIGPVYSMIKTDFNEFWLSSDNGVFAFSEDDLTLKKVELGFDDRCSQTIFQDKQSTLWISCEGTGVYKVVRETFFSSFTDPRIKSAFSLEALADDSILVGTSQDGLFKWIPETNELTQLITNDDPDLQTDIQLIKQTSKGEIWYANKQRLFKIDQFGEAREQNLPDNLNRSVYGITDLEIDAHDNLWITTGQGIYTLLDKEARFEQVNIEQVEQSKTEPIITQRIYRDRDNRMWISINDSLYLWDKETQIAKNVVYSGINPRDEDPKNMIYMLYQDSLKHIWISTSIGLFLLNESTNQFGLYSDYFAGNQNRSVLFMGEDKKGAHWLITETGVSQLNLQDKTFKHFDQLDGLPGSRFFHHPTSRVSDATFYLSSRNGIYYFDPQNAVNNRLNEQTRLINFNVLGSTESYTLATLDSSGISLDYDESNIKFEFATLDILNAQQIEYRYKLEGFDNDWIEIGNTNTATYTNLNGGQYVFRVRSSLKNDLFYDNELAINVQIGIPIWQRWWMFVVYAGLVILSILYYIQRQKQAVIELEKQVAEKTASIASESKKLQAANKIKTQFLANMSHEIRTPLTTVIGQAEAIICRDVAPEDIYKEVETIHDSSVYLLDIVNDILDLTQIEQKKFVLEYAPQDLHEVLKIVEVMFSFQAKAKGLTFNLIEDLSHPFIVNVDALRLKQILINLCSNAVKFTLAGHVSLHVSTNNKRLIFKVEDTGIGMDNSQLKQIFASFTQGDNTIKRRFGGSGLGLHLSNQFASLMKGTIEVVSELDKGSIFTFSLPIELMSSENQRLDIKDVTDTVEPDPLFVGTILLADDHDNNRRLLSRLLTKLGLTVYIAKDGFEVIESYTKNQPQVILLDIQMPNMDGIQAYKSLRALGCKQAIIALTANAMAAEVEEYFNLGFDGYIQKPIDRSLLISTIAKYYKGQTKDPQREANTRLANVDMSDLIAKFKSSLLSEQKELDHHWHNMNFDQLGKQVHNLSGAAHHFGFSGLSKKAITLENTLKSQAHNLDQVKTDINSLFNEIKTIMSD